MQLRKKNDPLDAVTENKKLLTMLLKAGMKKENVWEIYRPKPDYKYKGRYFMRPSKGKEDRTKISRSMGYISALLKDEYISDETKLRLINEKIMLYLVQGIIPPKQIVYKSFKENEDGTEVVVKVYCETPIFKTSKQSLGYRVVQLFDYMKKYLDKINSQVSNKYQRDYKQADIYRLLTELPGYPRDWKYIKKMYENNL